LLVWLDYLRLSTMRRREARREAGLLIHEHGEDAVQVVRAKIEDPARSTSRSELRLTLWYVRDLLAARRRRKQTRRSSRS
jgi:hypothetical protein